MEAMWRALRDASLPHVARAKPLLDAWLALGFMPDNLGESRSAAVALDWAYDGSLIVVERNVVCFVNFNIFVGLKTQMALRRDLQTVWATARWQRISLRLLRISEIIGTILWFV